MRKIPPWHRLSPRRLETERLILQSLPYFRFENETFGDLNEYLVMGVLSFRQPRSGKIEEFQIRVSYPHRFPAVAHAVFDHEKRFEVCKHGHLFSNCQLCLALPDRKAFSLGTESLTEEVLGASLVWFDKRLLFEANGRIQWPGIDEKHGAEAKVDFILESAGLLQNEAVVQWAYAAYQLAILESRFEQIERYGPCPCGSGRKLKFCHGGTLLKLEDVFRSVVSLAGNPILGNGVPPQVSDQDPTMM